MNGLVDRIHRWSSHVLRERRIRRWGMVNGCPWCRQDIQTGDRWSITAWDRDPSLDVHLCGNCGGTSVWLWGHGWQYFFELDPPKPALARGHHRSLWVSEKATTDEEITPNTTDTAD